MASEKIHNAHLSQELFAQLRVLREQMLAQYHAHRTGTNMPPEQSLALRSQISYITSVIEPEMHEMWPDYSPAEQQYLEEQSSKHARDINHIAMAALGPFAAPALVADKAGAQPEVVSNLIEIGFNATAVMGLGHSGARRSFVDEVLPPETMKNSASHIRIVSNQSLNVSNRPSFVAEETDPQVYKVVPEVTDIGSGKHAMNNGDFDKPATITHIKDFNNWRTVARKHYDDAIRSGEEAEPILEWLSDPQVEKLGLAVHAYGAGRGQLLADLKAESEGAGHSIDGFIEHYRTSPQGRSEAYVHALAFERKLVVDVIGADGEFDPTKLRLVVGKLNAGQYMTARDYAALEYMRDQAHQDFVHNAMETYLSLYKNINLTGEAGQKIIHDARLQAEAASPYAIKQASHDHQPVLTPDQAPEL